MADTRNITSQCQIVVFRWKRDGDLDPTGPNSQRPTLAQLAGSIPHDVSNYISNVSFSKQLANAAGEFNFTLEDSHDWSTIIQPGSWCLIYMSQDGGLPIADGKDKVVLAPGLEGDRVDLSRLRSPEVRAKLRCMGIIDSIRVQAVVGQEKGETDVIFNVSGRDFGAIYEETEIWHNRITYDASILEAASSKLNADKALFNTVDKLLSTLHDLFFNTEALLNPDRKDNSLQRLTTQWLLPQELFNALQIRSTRGTPYYGQIPNLLNFEETLASYPAENPVKLLNGIAWQRLKSHSIEQFHELFTELNDEGLPRLNFRPIPWIIGSPYGKFNKLSRVVKRLVESEADPRIIDLTPLDIFEFDIGKDNHARYNLFLSVINSQTVTVQDSFQMLKDTSPETGFPRLLENSIRRHGLRMMYSEINSLYTVNKEKADQDLLTEYNELMLEYWGRTHLYFSGSMSIVGNNNVKLGKVVRTSDDTIFARDMYFYIEGYEDSFTVGENGEGFWEQTINLTRGIESEALFDQSVLNRKTNEFKAVGNFTKSGKK